MFGVSLVVWSGVAVSCFPGFWPSFVHDWFDGHREVSERALKSLELVRSDGRAQRIQEPMLGAVAKAYNECAFMVARAVPVRSQTHLRFTLKNGMEILVHPARTEDDLYIVQKRGDRVVKEYWAKEPELFRFLAHQLWMKSPGRHAERRAEARPSHLRRVR